MAGTGSRRYHTKSRNGCTQCKKLRKKCDERPPRCGNCSRRGIKCSYEENFDNSLHSPPSSGMSSLSKDAERKTGCCSSACFSKNLSSTLPLPELQLMHTYATVTAPSLTRITHVLYPTLFTDIVPTEAASHSFLMHAVLALAAVHSAQQNSSNAGKFSNTAWTHVTKAESLFQKSSSLIDEGNADAIILFAFIFAIISFGSHDPVDFKFGAVNAFLDAHSALKVHWNLQPRVVRYVQDPCLRAWLRNEIPSAPPVPSQCQPLANKQLRYQVKKLQKVLEASDCSNEEKVVYRKTIVQLLAFFRACMEPTFTFGTIFGWLYVLLPDFIALVKARKPMALTILAHWAVPMHRFGYQIWFLTSWGLKIIREVAQEAPAEWSSLMEWPLQQISDLSGATTLYLSGHQPCSSTPYPTSSPSFFSDFEDKFEDSVLTPEERIPVFCRNPNVDAVLAAHSPEVSNVSSSSTAPFLNPSAYEHLKFSTFEPLFYVPPASSSYASPASMTSLDSPSSPMDPTVPSVASSSYTSFGGIDILPVSMVSSQYSTPEPYQSSSCPKSHPNT